VATGKRQAHTKPAKQRAHVIPSSRIKPAHAAAHIANWYHLPEEVVVFVKAVGHEACTDVELRAVLNKANLKDLLQVGLTVTGGRQRPARCSHPVVGSNMLSFLCHHHWQGSDNVTMVRLGTVLAAALTYWYPERWAANASNLKLSLPSSGPAESWDVATLCHALYNLLKHYKDKHAWEMLRTKYVLDVNATEVKFGE
jgi:hypothetical protein